MKCLIFSLTIVVFGMTELSAKVGDDAFQYKIRTEIKGLAKGDTLSFKFVHFPWGDMENAFDIIVTESEGFSFSRQAYNSQLFLMNYKPASGKSFTTNLRGLYIFVAGEGDILLHGDVENIYCCRKTGGVYDNTNIQALMELQNKLDIERDSFMRGYEKAALEGDNEGMNEYAGKYNSFDIVKSDEIDKFSKMKAEFMKNEPSSPLNIIEMLQQAPYMQTDRLEEYYKSLNDNARKSFYGYMLRQEIDNLHLLSPGNDAPFFIVNTADGAQITTDDCTGYYVLIYQYDLSEGSLTIDNEVCSFYEENKDKLKIIGVTQDLSRIKNIYDDIDPSAQTYGMNVKSVIEKMISHPWSDIESKDDNIQLLLDYAMVGYPFFVLISPEGKIMVRGFRDAFSKVRECVR